MRYRSRSLIMLMLAALLFAACGDSGGDTATDGDTPTGGDTATEGTDTPTPTAGESGALAQVDWQSSDSEVASVTVDGDSVSIDVGNDHTVEHDRNEPLRIAFFSLGTGNSYLQANNDGARDAADALGDDVEVTVFDADFDAANQRAQFENATLSGDFNAFIALALDSEGSCEPLSETAPTEDILSVIIIQPICGLDLESGIDLWAPGTLATVAGGGTLGFYEFFINRVAESLEEPTEVLYVTGPLEISPVRAELEALEQAESEFENFQLVDVLHTDQSSADALASTQNALVSHPDVDVIMSHFTPITTGILEALDQAAMTDDVLVYDVGGDEVAMEYLRNEQIEFTIPYFPYTAAACAVDMLYAAHTGNDVPRVVLNDCHQTPGGTTGEQSPIVVTPGDVSQFDPEY